MSEVAPEIQRADPHVRRRLAIATVAVAVLGTAGIAVFERWLRDAAGDSAVLLRVAWVVVLLMSLAPAVLAGYLWGMARRVRTAGVFPPPGYMLARDTEVRRGGRALPMARWLAVLAALLAAGAVGLPLLFWRLVQVLGSGA